MSPSLLMLAQSPQPTPPAGGGSVTWAMLWAVVLVAAIVAATWALMLIRNRTVGRSVPGEDGGFSLNELRDLHQQGRLSHKEYEAAKQRLLGPNERTTGRNPITGALRALPGVDLTGERLPRNEEEHPK